MIQEYQPPIDKLLQYAMRIADGTCGGDYLYCLHNDQFYLYDNGAWKVVFEIEFMGRISRSMVEINKFSISARKQVLENFKTIKYKKVDEFNWCQLINLKNGMVNPYDGTIEEHDKNYYSTLRLDYEFDDKARCELWTKTLGEILEGNEQKINILQEFFGYCLTRDTTQHKALLLLGESRSGKSTILQTLRAMIGADNCSSVPLKYIANPQATPMLMNKLVNIDTDVSAKAAEFEAEFKTITSGEPVHCNQKFIATFDFIPYCKLVMAANIFPKITDHSSAFYNRLILVPCDRVFSDAEQNRNLPKQLLSELPGILNWAIEGLKRLTERGRFEQHEFMRDAVQELEDENNPVNHFFNDHIEVVMGAEIEKGELFSKYKSWCEITKNFNLSQARFASCVFKRYHKETPKNTSNPETRKRVWRNIRHVENKKHIKQEDKGWQDA